MLAPKRVKFRKAMKGRNRGFATRGQTVAFGQFGLQALEAGWVSNRQLEAARVASDKLEERLDEDTLYVKTVTVDGGPALKRFMPAAMGRATPVKKRTSHVTIIVATKE